jgi:hypothetical protein
METASKIRSNVSGLPPLHANREGVFFLYMRRRNGNGRCVQLSESVAGVIWMSLLYPAGQPAHVLEVQVPDAVVAGWSSPATLDGIGPAAFADLPDLPGLNASLVRIAEV